MYKDELFIHIDGEVTAQDLSKFLDALQKLTYNLASALEAIDPKVNGTFHNKIREENSLIIKNMAKGSAKITFKTPKPNSKLFSECDEVITNVNKGDFDKVKKRYDNDIRGNRILNSTLTLYEATNKRVEITTNSKNIILDLDQKKPLRKYLSIKTKPREETIVGHLFGVDLRSKKMFKIESIYGTISIDGLKDKRIMEDLISKTNKIIKVKGVLKNNKTKYTLTLDKNIQIEEFNQITLNSYFINNKNLPLKKEIILDLEYDEDGKYYILSSKDLNHFTYSKSIEKASREMKELIGILYQEYVLYDESKLSMGALKLRKYLKEVIDDETN